MLKKKPIIGIIPTFVYSETDPYQDKANFVTMYSEKIEKSGGIPIGILGDVESFTSICDGYIWPGGNKILKEYIPIIKDAIQNKKPLLGVCLGAQALATALNIYEDQQKSPEKTFQETYEINKETNPYLKKLEEGNIHFHMVTKEKDSIENARHSIKIEKNTLLFDIVKKETLNVVSLHGMAIARVPSNMSISAESKDGVYEAIEYTENGSLLLGVQFHPEIERESLLFDWLVSSCHKYLGLVNREFELKYPCNYKIVEYHSKYPKCINDSNIEENTFLAWKKFQTFLHENGYKAEVESAYRTKELQEKIYNQIKQEEGSEYAKNYVAKPGFSEHELGLAIDVCLKKEGEWLSGFDKRLDDFYSFLKDNCADYGFIIRYPEYKEKITKYNYEPWHIRFVEDSKVAHHIMDNDLTLEEYLESE